MGIGGDLILTAAAREIRNKFKKKTFIIKKKNNFIKKLTSDNSPIFFNNPNISQFYSGKEIIIDRSKNKFSYAKKISKTKFFWKDYNIHAVNIICNQFNIIADSVNPDIFFDKKEYFWFKNFKKILPTRYITIEPFGKTDYTSNRLWFSDKWQLVINKVSKFIPVVQVGLRNKVKFFNVIDLTSQLTIRQTALVIKNSKLFVGTIGGLMHLSKATRTKSVILHSGFEPIGLCSYIDNHNINFSVECMPCGLRSKCDSDYECMKLIKPQIVIKAIKDEIY